MYGTKCDDNAAADAQWTGARLARRSGNQAIRHRIKRVDRLLGNRHLHNEWPMFDQLLCRQFMAGSKRPIILVDWSDLKADRSWLVLRAALWIRGAAVPIYESVHPLRDQNSPGVEQTFLSKLKSLLPEGLRPIVVTDAGFRGPWFTYLEKRCQTTISEAEL